MADVSLDDLIKKDKEKDKVNRLKQVPTPPFRNSNPKSSAIVLTIRRTDSQEATNPISVSLYRSAATIIQTTAGIIEAAETTSRRARIGPTATSRRRKKQVNRKKRYSALLESWGSVPSLQTTIST
jgi:hypothetical protein